MVCNWTKKFKTPIPIQAQDYDDKRMRLQGKTQPGEDLKIEQKEGIK